MFCPPHYAGASAGETDRVADADAVVDVDVDVDVDADADADADFVHLSLE